MCILTTLWYNKRRELQHDDLLLNICLKAESVIYPTNNALQYLWSFKRWGEWLNLGVAYTEIKPGFFNFATDSKTQIHDFKNWKIYRCFQKFAKCVTHKFKVIYSNNTLFQLPAEQFHNVHTVSETPSCYMYIFVNTTDVQLKQTITKYEQIINGSFTGTGELMVLLTAVVGCLFQHQLILKSMTSFGAQMVSAFVQMFTVWVLVRAGKSLVCLCWLKHFIKFSYFYITD